MKDSARTVRGYELYGSIAVVESGPREAKSAAKRLMLSNKNIKTVLRKGGAVSGKYRTRKLVYVAGAKNYLAEYRENGCVFRFDMRKVFFSTKLAYERKRISELAKDGEHVIVMFAGVGPYSIEIAKPHRKSKVVSIELNPQASRYARENALLNKTPNVVVEQGNVEKFTGKYSRFADRIVMPLPMDSFMFLPAALKMCAKLCTIHYYTFCKEKEVGATIAKLKRFLKSKGRRLRLIGWRAVRPYSATDIEIAVDFVVD